MKPVDIVILSVVVIVLGLIIYFNFYKKKDDPCKGCPYCSSCNNSCKNKSPLNK